MSERPLQQRVVTDLSALPMHGMGSASPTYWGTLGFMLLEGSGFALVIGTYFYLASLTPGWQAGYPSPDLGPGTWVTVLLLISLAPNYLVARWASAGDLHKVRIGLAVMTAFGLVPLVVRVYEFPALNVMWDSNAYGSTLWVLLGLHTTHLITDVIDTLVLLAIMFTRHGKNRRRCGDVQDNALYWNFVVLTWIPIYLCIYWVPRL